MKSHIHKSEEEYNPRLKALLLEVTENQIQNNEPPITRETFERLVASGHSENAAKEKIAAVVAMHVYDAMHDHKEFDLELFTKELNELK